MATKPSLEQRLWQLAQRRAAKFGFTFTPDCRAHFIPFLKAGAAKLQKEGFLKDRVRVALAEANVVSFTTQMIVEAKELGLKRLHEPTYHKARSSICPLWPFC